MRGSGFCLFPVKHCWMRKANMATVSRPRGGFSFKAFPSRTFSRMSSNHRLHKAKIEWLFVRWNLDRIRIRKYWFLRRGENRSTWRKTSQSREENQQQIQPTYCVESGNRSRATSVEGECSHYCPIPAPQVSYCQDMTLFMYDLRSLNFPEFSVSRS